MTRTTKISGLVMDVRQGDILTLGHNIKLHVLQKSGRVTRVRISAPLDVKIEKETDHGKECQDATQGLPL